MSRNKTARDPGTILKAQVEFMMGMMPDGKIKPEGLAYAYGVTMENYGVKPPSPAALQEILEKDEDIVEMLNKWYATSDNWVPEECNSMDTADRECISTALSMHFTGMHWPMYGDGNEYYAEWSKKYKEGIEKAGWTALCDLEKRG